MAILRMAMTSSRDQILRALQRKTRPFPNVKVPSIYRHMVSLGERSTDDLQSIFIDNAKKAACIVYQPTSHAEAVDTLLEVIGDEKKISSWELDQIPITGLDKVFKQTGVTRVGEDPLIRVGLTGVDAALAATGSLVLSSGPGRYRAASLLPPIHVAVVTPSQITVDLENWMAQQRAGGLDNLREASNIVIITGPSRTADIAMQLVMGMHGPREVHIILIEDIT
jgi:L-lactate dehydrogenase complex protein LldG